MDFSHSASSLAGNLCGAHRRPRRAGDSYRTPIRPRIWTTFGVLLLGGILWFVVFVIALSTRTARARLVRCALVTLGWISLQGASDALPLAPSAASPALQAMQAIGFFIVVGAFLVPIDRYADRKGF